MSAARWLAEQGVALVGGDTLVLEALRPTDGHTNLPVHTFFLTEAAILIAENLTLSALIHHTVDEFLFVALPLRLVGATGSPIRPVALTVSPLSRSEK